MMDESESTGNTDADLGIYEDTGTSSLKSPEADSARASIKRVSGSDVTGSMDEGAFRTRQAAEEAADRYFAAPSSDSQEKDSTCCNEGDGASETTKNQDWVNVEATESVHPTSDNDSGNLDSARAASHKLPDIGEDDGSSLSQSEDGADSNNLKDQGGSVETDNAELDKDEGKENTEPSDGVFITENQTVDDEDRSLSDVRPNTPDFGDTGDGNDTASESDIEEFPDLKQTISAHSHSARTRSAHSRARPATQSTIREDIASGHRAVANTPVSYYTNQDLGAETCRNLESRNTSHAGLELAREAVFQQAMTLMSNRCVSVQGARDGPLYGVPDTPYGPHVPEYFYVQQKKPAPMPPLKAWRGYHGNVYFEPIQISKVGGKDDNTNGQTDLHIGRRSRMHLLSRKSSSRQRVNTPAQLSRALVPFDKVDDRDSLAGGELVPATRSTTRTTNRRGAASAKSGTSSVAAISQHHLLYLDRHAVVNPDNSQMHEELDVIEKQQSTGSLAVSVGNQDSRQSQRAITAPGNQGDKASSTNRQSGSKSAKFDRICKGSVAHKLYRAKSGGSLGNSSKSRNSSGTGTPQYGAADTKTELMVIGDRFAPPTIMSPLLRTQTQYSLSGQRMTMNSPDLYGAFERLPPLEQVRISLRHMDARNDDGFPPPRSGTPYSTGGSIGVMEDLKPFIKYSPDVRARYNREIKYY